MSIFRPNPHPQGPAAVYLRTLCFIFCDDDVLLIHRQRPPDVGVWNAVGGKVDRGEDPLDAAHREVREEAGISPPLAFRGVATVVVQSTGEHWAIFLFTARVFDRTVTESAEGPLCWASLDDLAQLPVLPDVPLLLPHLRDDGGVIFAKFTYAAPDASSLVSAVVRKASPSDH
jgi:8-oxo-dGTP diphosphatase